MKFVGLSEDTFLEHINNLHGTKAPRRKPEKLVRECRVCGGNWQTDTELERHITREHLKKGPENKAPFAGFGPVQADSDEDSDSDDEYDNSIQYVESKSIRSKYKDEGVPSVRKRMDRDWRADTDKFLNNISTGSRRPHRRNQSSSSSDDEDDIRLRREIDKVQKRKMKLERSRPVCILCKELMSSSSSLETHLNTFHREQCFTCTEEECGHKAWVQLEQAVIHTRESRGHARDKSKEQLLARGYIKPPKCLESMSCRYCNPPMMIVGDTWKKMKTKLYEHMETHEHLHRDDEARIIANTMYGCRMCEVDMQDENELDRHMEKHKRSSSRRGDSPEFKSPAVKRGRLSSGDSIRET